MPPSVAHSAAIGSVPRSRMGVELGLHQPAQQSATPVGGGNRDAGDVRRRQNASGHSHVTREDRGGADGPPTIGDEMRPVGLKDQPMTFEC